MQKILFVGNEKPIKADVIILADNLVQIRGELEKNISGFQLLDEDNNVFGRYEGYTTLYKEIEGGFVLSNDGSVYVEPEPEPEPTEPTLEEVQEAKVFEMSVTYGMDIPSQYCSDPLKAMIKERIS